MSEHTPGPWQRSRFVELKQYRTMSKAWKRARRIEEAKIIRGPGQIGDPGCNVVARVECDNPADFTLMVAAADMLEILEWLDRSGGLGLDKHARIGAVIAKARGINA